MKSQVSLQEEGRERLDTFSRGGGEAAEEAHVGGMWPQAKEHWQPPEAGTGKEQISPTVFGGHEAMTTS